MQKSFAGEALFTNIPPNLDSERRILLCLMALSTFIFIGVIPLYITNSMTPRIKILHDKKEDDITENRKPTEKSSSFISSSKLTGIKKRKTRTSKTIKTVVTTTTKTSSGKVTRSTHTHKKYNGYSKPTTIANCNSSENESSQKFQNPPFILPLLNIIWIITIIYIVLLSSNNTYNARTTFQAPLFSIKECQDIIQMASKAAEINLENAKEKTHLTEVEEKYLEIPEGWHKARHSHYPTTDLNLISDPFSDEDRLYLGTILNSRLAPLIERVYGVTPKALRANDIFVVRYDAGNQSYLKRHTDSGDISFNVLLNSDFIGGGTRFWNRVTDENYLLNPFPGEVILSNAMINHEGVKINSGVRYILVGFINVDHIDPFTKKSTGLNIFASWLNMVWVLNRVKDGYQRSLERSEYVFDNEASSDHKALSKNSLVDNKYGRSLFTDYYHILLEYGDLWAPHLHINLFENPKRDNHSLNMLDETLLDKYFKVMDASYKEKEHSSASMGASWFKAQNLVVDFDGSFVRQATDELKKK